MAEDAYRKEVINPGDRASALAKEVCFQSHSNCPAVEIIPHQPGNFRGPISWRWNHQIRREMALEDDAQDWRIANSIENDGAGGKPQFFTLAGQPRAFAGLGWEIIAMCADDLARTGRFPAIMVNDIQARQVTEQNWALVKAAIEGYGRALGQAGLVNITGECAIMKHSITAFARADDPNSLAMTWSGACLGLTRRQLLLDSSAIEPGMPIVGLHEAGYRCNGGTFFTKLIQHCQQVMPDREYQERVLSQLLPQLVIPSRSYASFITQLLGWDQDGGVTDPQAEIAGIAHITGGGVWGKFGELLPDGVGALLDNMPKPCPALTLGQELSMGTPMELPDLQAYGTFHGGCGILIVVKTQADAKSVIDLADRQDESIKASIVGRTVPDRDGQIIIYSKFRKGQELSSLELESD